MHRGITHAQSVAMIASGAQLVASKALPSAQLPASKALERLAEYKAMFCSMPIESKETDAAFQALQESLAKGLSEADVDEVERQLAELSKKVKTERLYWAARDPVSTFPCAELLDAGSAEVKRRRAAADVLRATVERYELLEAEIVSTTACLELNVDQLKASRHEVCVRRLHTSTSHAMPRSLVVVLSPGGGLAQSSGLSTSAFCTEQAQERFEDAKDEFVKVNLNLKQAKRKKMHSAVEEREAEAERSKEAIRAAGKELSVAHSRLYERLAEFPELYCGLPDDVPEKLLPLLKQGRTLEQYTNREKVHPHSRHIVWKAALDGRTVALKEYRVDKAGIRTCFKEAELLFKCRHPAVVELEALFTDKENDSFYLQMPYYANGTLDDLDDGAKRSARYLIELLLPLSNAVAQCALSSNTHSCSACAPRCLAVGLRGTRNNPSIPTLFAHSAAAAHTPHPEPSAPAASRHSMCCTPTSSQIISSSTTTCALALQTLM